jgi:hypothetical protein
MVGKFSNYANAIKLEKMNPTEYTCHTFEPNYNNLNRVGLFIVESDLRKVENALNEIRNLKVRLCIILSIRLFLFIVLIYQVIIPQHT